MSIIDNLIHDDQLDEQLKRAQMRAEAWENRDHHLDDLRRVRRRNPMGLGA